MQLCQGASVLKRPLGTDSTLEQPLLEQTREQDRDYVPYELNEEVRLLRIQAAVDLAASMSAEQRCTFAKGMLGECSRKMQLLQHAASMHGKTSFADGVATRLLGQQRHQHEALRPLPLRGRSFPDCVQQLSSVFNDHRQFYETHQSECGTAPFWRNTIAHIEMADALMWWKGLIDA